MLRNYLINAIPAPKFIIARGVKVINQLIKKFLPLLPPWQSYFYLHTNPTRLLKKLAVIIPLRKIQPVLPMIKFQMRRRRGALSPLSLLLRG